MNRRMSQHGENTPLHQQVDHQTEEHSFIANSAKMLVSEILNQSLSDINNLFNCICMWEIDSDLHGKVVQYLHHFFELRRLFAEHRFEELVQETQEEEHIQTDETASPSGHLGPSQVQDGSNFSTNSVDTLVSEVLDRGCANINEMLQKKSMWEAERKEREGVHLSNFSERRVFAEEAGEQKKEQAAKAGHLDVSQELQGAVENIQTASNGPTSFESLKEALPTMYRKAIPGPHEDGLSDVPLDHHIMLEASEELNKTKKKEEMLSAKCARKVPKNRGGHGHYRPQKSKVHPNSYLDRKTVKESSGHKAKSKNSSFPTYCYAKDEDVPLKTTSSSFVSESTQVFPPTFTTSDHNNTPLQAAPLTEDTPPLSAPVTAWPPLLYSPPTKETPQQSAPLTEETPPVFAQTNEETPPPSSPITEETSQKPGSLTGQTPPPSAPLTEETPLLFAQINEETPPLSSPITEETPQKPGPLIEETPPPPVPHTEEPPPSAPLTEKSPLSAPATKDNKDTQKGKSKKEEVTPKKRVSLQSRFRKFCCCDVDIIE